MKILSQSVWNLREPGVHDTRMSIEEQHLYFEGRLIGTGTGGTGFRPVLSDRLGSVRWEGGTARRYFPFGEDNGASLDPQTSSFGTYKRESFGLDYAVNRHYVSLTGRFLTPDPSGASDPSSWNQYAYVGGDPVNNVDPGGSKIDCPWPGFCWDPDLPGPPPPPGLPPTPNYPVPIVMPPPPPVALGPAPGPYATPTWTGFNAGDGNTARKVLGTAQNWAKSERCDRALAGFNIRSVREALNRVAFSGDGQNVWNGRNSTYYLTFDDPKSHLRWTLPANSYFEEVKASVGAVVQPTQWGPQMFLGWAFFDPSLAGVTSGYGPQAQAIMTMNQSMHLLGFRDLDFSTSKRLTNLLVDACQPFLRRFFGGLVQ